MDYFKTTCWGACWEAPSLETPTIEIFGHEPENIGSRPLLGFLSADFRSWNNLHLWVWGLEICGKGFGLRALALGALLI